MSEPQSNPTRVQLQPKTSEGRELVAAREKGPTLMAGQSAGQQGIVQVRTPQRQLIRRQISVAGGVSLLWLTAFVIAIRHHHWFNMLQAILYLPMGLVAVRLSSDALRRPCYITMDEEGLGVTTNRSSRALRWSEIQAIRLTTQGFFGIVPVLELYLSELEELNLSGYSKAQRKNLFVQIVERAGLQSSSSYRDNLYCRPGVSPWKLPRRDHV